MNSFFWRAALNRKQRDYGFVFAQLGIITAPGEPQCPQWEAKKRFQNLTPLELPTLSPRMYCAWEPETEVSSWCLGSESSGSAKASCIPTDKLRPDANL
jgi:hypothetical protein